jgi:hypothetical protein
VYEPVSAFHEPDRSRWASYAVSDTRPRRRDALAAEHAHVLRRLLTSVSLLEEGGEHAYVRSLDGVWYVCPWQIELRSLLASGGGLVTASGVVARSPHIRQRNWTVPLAWFVPFAGPERWLSLGVRGEAGGRGVHPRATVQLTRTVVYVTPMSQARRRVARGLAALRGLHRLPEIPEPGIESDLAVTGRWLEEFHPYSLVELDYGGLVQLLSDEALSGDESAAELSTAIDGMSRGRCEVALAMYRRAQARWQAFGEFEQVN